MAKWKHLTVFPEVSAPYHYDTESLPPGMLMKLVKDWSERGIDIEIVLHQNYDSPLLKDDVEGEWRKLSL